nr:MAG TPA: hypothetical protein [Caudoviricetes sp.]
MYMWGVSLILTLHTIVVYTFLKIIHLYLQSILALPVLPSIIPRQLNGLSKAHPSQPFFAL